MAKIRKLMYTISKALLISFFILMSLLVLLIMLNIYLKYETGMLTVSIIVFFSFLITFALSYRIKIPINDSTKKLEKQYPEVPFIIMGLGYLLFLIDIYLVLSEGFHQELLTTVDIVVVLLIFFSLLVFIPIGIVWLIITLAVKRSLDGRVFFTLKEANEIIDDVDDKNRIDTKNLKRYIHLTYKNIKNKIGEELKLEPPNESNIASPLDLEYTFLRYLPHYIEFAGKEQLQSLKNNLETMLNSVNEKDEIKWSNMIKALLKLNDDITTYLKENNFNLTYHKLPRHLEWINKNKDTIIQAIGLIVPIIVAILSAYLQSHFPILKSP